MLTLGLQPPCLCPKQPNPSDL